MNIHSVELKTGELNDLYGHARMPQRMLPDEVLEGREKPETIERIKYGRFRNVYLYITEQCQLRCKHCYMGDRLERALRMPTNQVLETLTTWRKMGGSKLTLLGGEPTLHPDFERIVKFSNDIGYEDVIVTTNALRPTARVLGRMDPSDFAYVQVSLDGASSSTHDRIRGRGTFKVSWQTTKELCNIGFDTRIICTVNRVNMKECLNLLEMADEIGVSLVKFHVFSGIGYGKQNEEWLVQPQEWIDFYNRLKEEKGRHKTRIWYQPTYARRNDVMQFAEEGFRGCVGRTLDRISIFPDGRAYVCSYLFDTNLNFAHMKDGSIELNKEFNEFDLFTRALTDHACGSCKVNAVCNGGCPAESIVMGDSSCGVVSDLVPICRLWKSEI